MNLQNTFLNRLRKEGIPVNIFLIKGTRLRGTVRSFDTFTILLENKGIQVLIYKQAIATIVPESPVKDLNLESPKE